MQEAKIVFLPESARQAELIYHIMSGAYARAELPPEAQCIENISARGAYCERLYNEMMETCVRRAKRLAPGEEEELDIFFDNMLDFCQYVGVRMYQYGQYYAMRPERFPRMPARRPDP